MGLGDELGMNEMRFGQFFEAFSVSSQLSSLSCPVLSCRSYFVMKHLLIVQNEYLVRSVLSVSGLRQVVVVN